MIAANLIDWIDAHAMPQFIWYAKRLSANDTLANNTHQAGPYIPKEFLFVIFPILTKSTAENPDVWFELRIASHHDIRKVRAVWYNNKQRGGTRDETRLTNFGGASSAFLDPESTGSLVLFCFDTTNQNSIICDAWVCDHDTEADIIEERIGSIEPGKGKLWKLEDNTFLTSMSDPHKSHCQLSYKQIPREWLKTFPSGKSIIEKAVELCPKHGSIDEQLLQRRKCEFEIFRTIEEAFNLETIHHGFPNMETFINFAQSILQRRKSRSGRSLELHIRTLFLEEGLQEGIDFEHQPESESNKRPDFLFPSQDAYQDTSFPNNKLRMLAVKTTCKDRWRQILNEADRITEKHLLTLQEGVSEKQFSEMTAAGVKLVIPATLKSKYPLSIQPYLQSLESFLGDVRHLRIEED